MREGHSTMVRIALLDQHMAIEASHLRNGEYTNAAERTSLDVEDFAFCDVSTQLALAVTLQAVESDRAGCQIAFERAAGEVRIASFRLEETVLNQLILDSAVRAQLALRRIAAMEAHEGIGQCIVVLALDVFIRVTGSWDTHSPMYSLRAP